MYQTRLRPAGVNAETEFHKTDDLLIRGVQGDYTRGDTVVLLDPKGYQYPSSEELANAIYDWFQQGGSRLVFVIGGGKMCTNYLCLLFLIHSEM